MNMKDVSGASKCSKLLQEIWWRKERRGVLREGYNDIRVEGMSGRIIQASLKLMGIPT